MTSPLDTVLDLALARSFVVRDVDAALGTYHGLSLSDFALGGRRIPWWAVMASIIAAETSAATFLGAPGEGFDKKSLAYVQLTLGLIIGRFVVGNLFLRPYYQFKVYTVYDYLGIRFQRSAELPEAVQELAQAM